MTSTDFGFIITRHVNSHITNKYWNDCIRCIRTFYPFKKIVVIDDNSDKYYLKEYFDYKNIEYIESEFHGRGELLPYYYYYKNNYFDNVVIIHDSTFIQQRIKFENLIEKGTKVIPFWHFNCEKKENISNTARLINSLSNNYLIMTTLFQNKEYDVLGKFNNDIWSGCFGLQTFINRNFLLYLESKYKLFNLLNVVVSRQDRCCLERIMGIIFFIEYLRNIKMRSLLGDIKKYCKWGYTYIEYKENCKNKKISNLPIIKVWSGR
jgi:hypothetical protein